MARPFIPAVDTARVELHYDQDGQKVENVIYAKKPGGFDAEALEDLCGVVKSWWVTNLKPQLTNQIGLTDIKAIDMSSVNGPTFTYTAGLPEIGSITSGPMPSNVSLAAKLNSAGRGRSVTGRFFVAGLPKTIATSNQITSQMQATLVAAFNTLISDLFTIGASWVVASFVGGGNYRLTALLSEVIAVTVESVLDSQRRRLPGRGR